MILLLLPIFTSLFVLNVRGHNPSKMVLAYDVESQKLNVTITHGVSDPDTHHIESVTVSVNGEEVISKNYDTQPTKNEFTYQYDVEASEGDTIEVQAVCSQVGSISETIKAGEESTSTEGQGIPGFMGLFVLATIFTAMMILFTKRRINKSN